MWQRRQLTCGGGLWEFSCGDHLSERQWLSPGRGGVGRGSTREGAGNVRTRQGAGRKWTRKLQSKHLVLSTV